MDLFFSKCKYNLLEATAIGKIVRNDIENLTLPIILLVYSYSDRRTIGTSKRRKRKKISARVNQSSSNRFIYIRTNPAFCIPVITERFITIDA